MAEPSTYIKLDRNILNWRWYGDINTFKVFIHLLLKANFEAKSWREETIERGQLVTSIRNLSAETGLTIQQTRTAINRLISTQEITQRSTSQYTVISIENYDKYQSPTQTTTSEQHATNKPPTNEQQQLKKEKNKRTKEDKKRDICASAFETFWQSYPRKISKQNALKAWNKISPDTELQTLILKALEQHKLSPQWAKDDGQFIPHAATWLNAKRWEDEPDSAPELKKRRSYTTAAEYVPPTGPDDAELLRKFLNAAKTG